MSLGHSLNTLRNTTSCGFSSLKNSLETHSLSTFGRSRKRLCIQILVREVLGEGLIRDHYKHKLCGEVF